MEILEKIRNLFDKAFLVLGGVAVLALMTLATGNVCLRIFGMPYRGAYELVSFLGAVVTAFALGYTQRRKSHIVVDILTETFSAGSQEESSTGSATSWDALLCDHLLGDLQVGHEDRCLRGSV